MQVYAIVQDRAGHYVAGLKACDFVVKEDGNAVDAAAAERKRRSHLHRHGARYVVEHADRDDRGDRLRERVRASTRWATADQTFVVAFDEEPRLVQPLTSNRKAAQRRHLRSAAANGGTAIWDAVLYSLQQFRGVSGKRALVVFTDGNQQRRARPR